MMKFESGIVLSIPQLRICLELMDCPDWDDLPLAITPEPVEQRMMNAFLGMVQAGWLVSTPEGYELEADFQKLIVHIGQAEQVFHLHDGRRIWAILYVTAGSVVSVMPDWGNWDHCRIRLCPDSTTEQVAAAIAEGREGLMLRKYDPAMHEQGQYELEQLVFFFNGKMEETE